MWQRGSAKNMGEVQCSVVWWSGYGVKAGMRM